MVRSREFESAPWCAFGGVDAGEVLRMQIPSSPAERFVVTMRVREDLHGLVRTDSAAAVLTDGLLGNVFLQIREGTATAALLEPGGRVRGIDAIEIADLITEGRDTFRVLAGEFVDLRQDFGETVDLLDDTVQATTLLLEDVGNDVRAISTMSALFMDEARTIAVDTRLIFDNIKNGQGTVGKLLTDDTLYERASEVVTNMDATMGAIRGASEHAEAILGDFSRARRSERRDLDGAH